MLNRILVKKRKKTFVLIIPRFEDIFHSYYAGEIIKGVSTTASRLGIDVLVHITDRLDHRRWLDSSLLDINYISGIIFGDIDNDLGLVSKTISKGIPTIVLNNYLQEPINCIAIDNHQATLDIISHFIQLGHSKIATIAGDLNTQSGHTRFKSFQEALQNYGIKIPKYYLTIGEFLRTPARKAALRLIKMKNRPTAIFAASDVMALELLDVARSNNIKVPQELSIFGFDDNPLITTSFIPLSTVSQPLMEMARLGTEQLAKICQGEAKLPVKIMLSPKLIHRKSVVSC